MKELRLFWNTWAMVLSLTILSPRLQAGKYAKNLEYYTRTSMAFPIYGSHSSSAESSKTTMILSYAGPNLSSVTIQSTLVSLNPASTWIPDEYGSFNFLEDMCDNVRVIGLIKYGSFYKHKYEMIGWCSQNSGKELFTTEILWDSKKYNHAVLLNLWKLELLLFVFLFIYFMKIFIIPFVVVLVLDCIHS